jgi:hypothetical protein
MDVEDLAINSINRLKWWIDFPPRLEVHCVAVSLLLPVNSST